MINTREKKQEGSSSVSQITLKPIKEGYTIVDSIILPDGTLVTAQIYRSENGDKTAVYAHGTADPLLLFVFSNRNIELVSFHDTEFFGVLEKHTQYRELYVINSKIKSNDIPPHFPVPLIISANNIVLSDDKKYLLYCAREPYDPSTFTEPWALKVYECCGMTWKRRDTYMLKTLKKCSLLARPKSNDFIISSIDDERKKGKLEWIEVTCLPGKKPTITSRCTQEFKANGAAAIAWDPHTNNLVTYQYNQNGEDIFQTWSMTESSGIFGKKYKFQVGKVFKLPNDNVNDNLPDNAKHIYQLKFISDTPSYLVAYNNNTVKAFMFKKGELNKTADFNGDVYRDVSTVIKLTISDSGRMVDKSGKTMCFSDIETWHAKKSENSQLGDGEAVLLSAGSTLGSSVGVASNQLLNAGSNIQNKASIKMLSQPARRTTSGQPASTTQTAVVTSSQRVVNEHKANSTLTSTIQNATPVVVNSSSTQTPTDAANSRQSAGQAPKNVSKKPGLFGQGKAGANQEPEETELAQLNLSVAMRDPFI